jgi:hypothetical protein
MKTRRVGLGFVFLPLVVALGACSGAESRAPEAAAATSSALMSTGLLPYPVKTQSVSGDAGDSGAQQLTQQLDPAGKPIPVWDGTIVDLMAADAFAQCAANSPQPVAVPRDKYLAHLAGLINNAACPRQGSTSKMVVDDFTIENSTTTAGRWALHRLTPACNADSTSGSPKAIKLKNSSRHSVTTSTTPTNVQRAADNEVNFGEINLCMAQRLREVGASGDSLFLSADDQRQLLEVTRERAQIAMLQYAALGNVLVTPTGTAQAPLSDYQIIPTLQTWAQSTSNADKAALGDLGLDFANAVQLHVIASRELAELLWRSASASMPRGGIANTSADEAWGPGSWRQRMMALLYGGDPLVQVKPSEPAAPWTHFDEANVTYPGDAKISIRGDGKGTVTWPNDRSAPVGDRDPLYVTASQDGPEAGQLLSFARRFNVLNFMIDSQATTRADVNVNASATQLYKSVEAWLRYSECTKTVANTCSPDTELAAMSGQDLATAYQGGPGVAPYLLWTRHRIRPTHATDIVSQVAAAIPKVMLTSGAPDATKLNWPGALRLVGSANTLIAGSKIGASGTWYHVDPNAQMLPIDNVDRAPLYTRFASYRVPSTLDASVQAQWTGLIGYMSSDESPRIFGAISALAAVRDALRISIPKKDQLQSGQAGVGFFSRSDQILAIIDAAIGASSLSIIPSLSKQQGRVDENAPQSGFLDGCWNASDSCWLYTQDGTAGTNAKWEVGVTLGIKGGIKDPFADGKAKLVVVPSGWLTSTLALRADAQTFHGKKMSDAVAAAANTPAIASTTTTITRAQGNGFVQQTWFVTLPSGASPMKYSFLLQSGDGLSYRLLGEDVELRTFAASLKSGTPVQSQPVNYPVEGQYIAYGGDLGGMARQAWSTTQAYSPEPSFDGFGQPLRWVPPADPRLFGGTPGDDAPSYYLRTARQAADKGTDAVKYAIEELLKEQADDAVLAAAQRRAAGVDAIEQQSLCGDQNSQCDTSTVTVNLNMPSDLNLSCKLHSVDEQNTLYKLVDDLSGGNVSSSKKAAYYQEFYDACMDFQKIVNGSLSVGRSAQVSVGTPVSDLRNLPVAPDFAAYKGGALQGVFVDEWGALHHAERAAQDFGSIAQSAWSRIDESYRLNQFKTYKTVKACGRDIVNGFLAGLSFSFQPGEGGGWGLASISWSPGPLLQAISACEDAKAEEAIVGNSQVVASVTESFAQLSTQSSAFADSLTAMQAASVRGDRAVHEAGLAKARADLEASVAKDTLFTKLNTYRRYHSYDMWRARALLENARRYGVAARRAIESRFVVDLSTMRASEPFVAAPSTWSDEIYEYDLNAPSSVGLTALPKMGDGIYPNRISDYIGNLEGFVNGYAIARPTAVAKSDDDVLSMGGPDEHAVAPDSTLALTKDARRWQFLCPDGTWVGRVPVTTTDTKPPVAKSFAQLCVGGVKPTRARIDFTLDPWARVEGDLAQPPFDARFNARWQRLAVNLVGTGVRDCALAAKPADCYTQSYLTYDLVHTGPAWATSFEHAWRVLDFGRGVIESAKAITAEEWLDPVSNGWGKPYVEAVARTELTDRPFGGAYELTLDLGPEARPERIDRVQILLQSTYWVKQQ